MAEAMAHTEPFLAFVSDADGAAVKQFAQAHGWPETCVYQGTIAAAAEFLKTNPSPPLLLVEIPSANEAKGLLDALAEVCAPTTKVIVCGTVNEFSFYNWLMEIGISGYLLKPLTASALEGEYLKAVTPAAAAAAPAKKPAKVIGVIGARGGVGSTTVALNLAGIIAEAGKQNTALVDLDPQDGSIALSLDLEPSRGFRDALERPERIDPLFIDRVTQKHGKHLSILSAEETLQERLVIHDTAAETLLSELRDKFQVVVLDLPRHLNAFTRRCLGFTDETVVVGELALASLRDTLRISDALRESLRLKPPVIVANRVGLSKQGVKPADFEKGINAKIAFQIPFAADVYMQIGADIPAVKSKSHAAVKPLYQLAARLLPEAKIEVSAEKDKKKGGLFARKPKEEKAETPAAPEAAPRRKEQQKQEPPPQEQEQQPRQEQQKKQA